MAKRQTHRQRLHEHIREAEAQGNITLVDELKQVLMELQQPRSRATSLLIKRLKSPHRDVKYFVGRVLETVKDQRVIKPLMRAAMAPENEGYRANFIWACSAYDCTKHLPLFVRFMLRSTDPGEHVMACLLVIDNMKGPFEPKTLKLSVTKLLQRNSKQVADSDLRALDELFIIRAADMLLMKYHLQVELEYKART